MSQALTLHFSVGSKVIHNNCAKEGEPGDEAKFGTRAPDSLSLHAVVICKSDDRILI